MRVRCVDFEALLRCWREAERSSPWPKPNVEFEGSIKSWSDPDYHFNPHKRTHWSLICKSRDSLTEWSELCARQKPVVPPDNYVRWLYEKVPGFMVWMAYGQNAFEGDSDNVAATLDLFQYLRVMSVFVEACDSHARMSCASLRHGLYAVPIDLVGYTRSARHEDEDEDEDEDGDHAASRDYLAHVPACGLQVLVHPAAAPCDGSSPWLPMERCVIRSLLSITPAACVSVLPPAAPSSPHA